MTTETLPPPSDAVRWARHSLRIDDAELTSLTAELLRRVTEWEYVVSPEVVDAVQLLANPEGLAAGSNIAALATQRGREQRCEVEVADFANEFFDLTPDQRGQRWQFLMDECQTIPRLVDQLCDLSLGVEIAGVPTSTDDLTNELVQACCKIFVARPPAKIRMRQEFMAMCRADPHPWEAAAQELRSTDANFVSHVAPWVNDLACLSESDVRRERESLGLLFRASDAKGQQPAANQNRSQGSWGWIFAFILFAVLKLALRAPSRPEPPPNVPLPKSGRVLTPEETRSLFPLNDTRNEAERKRFLEKHLPPELQPSDPSDERWKTIERIMKQ